MSAPFAVTAWADRLKKMPIWAFHGSDDNLVPIGGTQDLIDALRALGNNVRFTVLPGRDQWDPRYLRESGIVFVVLGAHPIREGVIRS
jgi:predicted esterase